MRTIKKNGRTVRVLQNAHEARRFVNDMKYLCDGGIPALDFETTALRPTDSEDAHVRLTAIAINASTAYVIDHRLCGSFASYCEDLIEAGPYYVFNVNFEGRWFEYEAEDVTALTRLLYDVAHMRRSVMGGGPWGLKTMAKVDLKVELNKDLQNSGWSNPDLTVEQYFYSGEDAIYTKQLGDFWNEEMSPQQWEGFFVINDAWRAVNECEDTGLLLDEAHHERLIAMWHRRRDAAETAFRKYIPEEAVKNMRSKKQMSDFLKSILDQESLDAWPATEKTAQLSTERKVLRGMSYIAPYPLSRALACYMVYTRADKYIGTYGETLLTKQRLSHDGRVRGRLNMAAAITGRFSSSNPNMQNFPRHPLFRFTFIAGRGRKLILADYSGVEIRVLAEVSGDKILLHDAIYDDVHSRSAIAIYQIADPDNFIRILKHDEVKSGPLSSREKALKSQYKEMRSKAKAFTFQLLYGAGPGALAIALRCTPDEAQDAINKWAARYSKAYGYRPYMYEKMMHTGFMPCASGRTIFVKKWDRSMPVAANYPIQGSAGDVMYRAMYRTQQLLDNTDLPVQLMVSVHDELLLLSETSAAEEAKEILKAGMLAGWLDIFPDSNTDNLADVVIGDRWSDKA